MTFAKDKSVSELLTLLDSGAYSVHEVATVLKNLLAEMPEPLLIEGYYPLHCSLASKHIATLDVSSYLALVSFNRVKPFETPSSWLPNASFVTS